MTADLLAAAESLGLRDVELDETGADFLVAHAKAADGTRWVLRAPRRESVVDDMAVEGRVLDVLRSRLPVAVPHWTIRAADHVGYRRLPGEPLAVKEPGGYRWSGEPSDAYLDRLGEVIAVLHAVPSGEFAHTGVEVRTPWQVRDRIDRALHRAREPLGIPDALWRRWREWVADDDVWPPRTVLVHADVHPGHTLVDAAGDLVGVLDWTDVVVGDPAADFRRIGPAFGPDGLARVLAAYGRHGGAGWPGMHRHIAERAAMAPVTSGLFGLDSGQDRYVRAARAALASRSPGTGSG